MAVFKKIEGEEETTYAGTTNPVTSSEKTSSIIGKSMFIKGNISSDEDILVEGKVEGKLNVAQRVIIGKSGLAKADIEARQILIKGTVNGNVTASYKVEIVPEGKLNGNIVAQRVVLAEGALFRGSVDMTTQEK